MDKFRPHPLLLHMKMHIIFSLKKQGSRLVQQKKIKKFNKSSTHATYKMDECDDIHIPTCMLLHQGDLSHSYVGPQTPHRSAQPKRREIPSKGLPSTKIEFLCVTRMCSTWRYVLKAHFHVSYIIFMLLQASSSLVTAHARREEDVQDVEFVQLSCNATTYCCHFDNLFQFHLYIYI